MALTVAFSASQVVSTPGSITFTDASTGVDAAVTQRRIYVRDSLGNYIVPTGILTAYSAWADYPATTTKTLALFTSDIAISVTIQWLDVSGTVLYDKTQYYGLSLYLEIFDYGLTQLLAGNPMLVNDNKFLEYKGNLRTHIDSGNQAVELASDITAAQLCYDRANDLKDNAQYYFNRNS